MTEKIGPSDIAITKTIAANARRDGDYALTRIYEGKAAEQEAKMQAQIIADATATAIKSAMRPEKPVLEKVTAAFRDYEHRKENHWSPARNAARLREDLKQIGMADAIDWEN